MRRTKYPGFRFRREWCPGENRVSVWCVKCNEGMLLLLPVYRRKVDHYEKMMGEEVRECLDEFRKKHEKCARR